MRSATYIGPPTGWNIEAGMRAQVRDTDKPGVLLAQFDDFHARRKGKDLSSGWHEFPAEHFQIDASEDDGAPQ